MKLKGIDFNLILALLRGFFANAEKAAKVAFHHAPRSTYFLSGDRFLA
jgi:hypothetical protein